MPTANSKPRVLIVDDDEISLRFLETAVAQCGCAVSTAANGAAALAADGELDLLLIDRHLPDMDGTRLLCALRERGIDAPAIATSAEIDTTLASQLRAAGFADVLEKPTSIQCIAEIVRRHLSRLAPDLLDDGAALSAIGGDEDALRALRGLLAQELDALERDLAHADLAADALGERLHRLRASCGFCGAVALAARVAQLQDALRAGNRLADEQRDAFASVCRETAMALRSQS